MIVYNFKNLKNKDIGNIFSYAVVYLFLIL